MAGNAANTVINGTLTYVSGGTTYSFWCAITRAQKQGSGGTAQEAAYYCYDNATPANAYGYLLVIKQPPANQAYTTTKYSPGGNFDLDNVPNNGGGFDTYRTDYIATLPTSTPSKAPTKVPSTSPSKAPSNSPTLVPSKMPSTQPSKNPTTVPTTRPTAITVGCFLCVVSVF
jgi:hypothetical protein